MSATGLRVLLVNCNTPMDNLIPAGVSLLSAVLKAEGCQVRNPYHGTRLREIAEAEGYIAPDEVAGDYRKEAIMRMPQLGPEAIKGLQRTFPLYVKLPKARWPEIRRAEALTPEGDGIYTALAQEYTERHG